MRENKLTRFRAYHERTKTMFNVAKIDFRNDFIYSYEKLAPNLYEELCYPLSECKLMPDTGLKDCEGQEIYECDIVQDINNNNSLRFGKDNNLSPVEFHEGSFGISVIYDGTFCSFSPCDQSDQEGFKFKVIGNIYENKELLKK